MASQSFAKQLLLQNALRILKPSSPTVQSVRHRGGVMPHRKPRWFPVAPSKKFRLPPQDHIPQNEVDQLLTLRAQYQEKMAALTQYLWEDYLRNSDVGQAAILEAEREEAEHKKLLEANDKVNAEIAMRRKARLERESQEEAIRIQEELKLAEEMKQKKIAVANKIIESETEAINNRIRAEDLERAIETALQNPIDPEFAIDLQGNIYRGRYTKSIEVPVNKREKIPVPLTVAERILSGQKTF